MYLPNFCSTIQYPISIVSAVSKCEIACRPIGHGFYQALGRNFTNGTSCSADSTNVCVNGECKVSMHGVGVTTPRVRFHVT